LEVYKTGEETTFGYYVVIDVGKMGRKDAKLIALKNAEVSNGKRVSPIIFIDGIRRPSASKLQFKDPLKGSCGPDRR
jgi:hypothetical protein